MKEIKATIRENRLDTVIDALAAIPGLPGIAVVHVREYGRATNDGALIRVDVAKLEIDVDDALAHTVVETIVTHARTGDGHPGDGRVFLSDLREVIRIADGQPDHVAGDNDSREGKSR